MTTEPTNDTNDQELANALAGISSAPAVDALKFEETPSPSGPVVGSPFGDSTPAAPVEPAAFVPEPVVSFPAPVSEPLSAPEPVHVADDHTATVSSDPALEGIKKDALNELRPLVDKLNVSAEEKFDTYLLLLRSTDDTSLIGPAHDAAKDITDEARRAQALLDIIKEIDYLSQSK